MDADWTTYSQSASYVGKPGDPHQTLLDILALNPSSVEYYSRDAESLAQLFNMMNVFALGPGWFTALTNLNLQAQAVALLNRLGYTGSSLPGSAEPLFPHRQSADHHHHRRSAPVGDEPRPPLYR